MEERQASVQKKEEEIKRRVKKVEEKEGIREMTDVTSNAVIASAKAVGVEVPSEYSAFEKIGKWAIGW